MQQLVIYKAFPDFSSLISFFSLIVQDTDLKFDEEVELIRQILPVKFSADGWLFGVARYHFPNIVSQTPLSLEVLISVLKT